MASTSLKRLALYIKIEQKINNVNQLYKMLSKAVGYHPFYEESFLSSFFCFWRIFQDNHIEHHALEAYLEKVGRIYGKLNKGKLPIFIIDGVSSLARENAAILDDLAYMAKGLAETRSLITVFGLLEAFGPCVLNSRGYNINKQSIYLPYSDQKEVELYAGKAISKNHPLRKEALKAISEENAKIYGNFYNIYISIGGHYQYISLLINQIHEATTMEQIEKAKEFVENKVLYDVADELKKSSNY